MFSNFRKISAYFNSALALILSASLAFGFFDLAQATEINDAQNAVESAVSDLSSAQAQLDAISSECEALGQEINILQGEIDEAISKVMEAQAAMLEGRESLSSTVVGEYKTSGFSMILSAVFGAKSLDGLLRDIRYTNDIMNHYSEEVEYQKSLRQTFIDLSTKLTNQKNEQDEKWNQLQQKLEEASSLVAEASENLALSESQLNALKEQEAQMQEQAAKAASNAALSVDESSVDDNQAAIGDTTQDSSPGSQKTDSEGESSASQSSTPSTSSGTNNNASSSVSGQWLSGIASAYGGSSDPYTPNPGTTATGAICDDNSMGVAVPMSLANYRSYFGRTVEISYNGMTVYATVNDCGYMSGGARSLDLQPGVFKAFGYSTCQAWGLRNVSYRFL